MEFETPYEAPVVRDYGDLGELMESGEGERLRGAGLELAALEDEPAYA